MLATELLLRLKDQVTPQLGNINRTSNRVFASMSKNASKHFGKMTADFQKSSALMRSGMMTIFKGAAIAAPVVGLAKMASEFEKGMAEIATVTDLTKKQVERDFTSIIENAQVKFGENFKKVQKAMYDGFSAGVPQTKKAAAQYIEAVGRFATIGMTDFATAGDLFISASNAFRLSMDESGETVNKLFNIVKQGKTTVPELAASFGQISGLAGGLGLKLEDVGAAIATLTPAGFNTANAVTGIKASLNALTSPGKAASDMMKRIGFYTDSVKLKQTGLQGTIKILKERVDAFTKSEAGRVKVLQTLFPNIRAQNAMLALAGNLSEAYAEKNAIMNKNLDVTTNRFKEVADTADQKFKGALQSLTIAGKELGRNFVPILTDMVEELTPLVQKFTTWVQKNPELVKAIGKATLALSGLTIGIGIAKFAFGGLIALRGVYHFLSTVGSLALSAGSKLMGLATSTSMMNIAMKATPWGIIIAGVAAWSYVISEAIDPTKELGKNVGLLTSNWQGFGNMLERISAIYNKNKGFLTWLFTGGAIDTIFGTNLGVITDSAAKAVSDVDRLARQAGISPALAKTGGETGKQSTNYFNFELNQSIPEGANAQEIAAISQKAFEKAYQNMMNKNQRLSLGGVE